MTTKSTRYQQRGTTTAGKVPLASEVLQRETFYNVTDGKIFTKNGSDGIVQMAPSMTEHNAKAPTASPTFTGTPAAPTAAADDNSTKLATTAFVIGQAASATPAMNGSAAVGTSLKYARGDHVHPTDTSRAPLASPAFTGTPTAPTAAAGTATTQIATTSFVATAVANLVASSPAALDTLNELAAALGDDANFASTMTTALAGKEPVFDILDGGVI